MAWNYRVVDWHKSTRMDKRFIKLAIKSFLKKNNIERDQFSDDLIYLLLTWVQRKDGLEILFRQDMFHRTLVAELGKYQDEEVGGIDLFWEPGENNKWFFSINPIVSIPWKTINSISWGIGFGYGPSYTSHNDWEWDMTDRYKAICDRKEMGYLEDDKKEQHIRWCQILFDDHVLLKFDDDTVLKVKVKQIIF